MNMRSRYSRYRKCRTLSVGALEDVVLEGLPGSEGSTTLVTHLQGAQCLQPLKRKNLAKKLLNSNALGILSTRPYKQCKNLCQ